jgi:hypothetical protein
MVTFLVIIILIVTRPVEDYQQFERLKLETPTPPVRKIAYNLRDSHPVFDSLGFTTIVVYELELDRLRRALLVRASKKTP